jgi:hypothetical protein
MTTNVAECRHEPGAVAYCSARVNSRRIGAYFGVGGSDAHILRRLTSCGYSLRCLRIVRGEAHQ